MRLGPELGFGYSAGMNTRKRVTVCINYRANPDLPSCGARGGNEVAQALKAAVSANNLPVEVVTFNCLGECERGPNVKLSPSGEFCHGVRLDDLAPVLEKISAFAGQASSRE